MAEQNLGKWIRQEHDHVDALAAKLREAVAITPRSCGQDWIERMRTVLNEFRDHLTKHMELEENGGYMDAVLERRPTLSHHVDRLEQEHRDMSILLNDLHELGQQIDPNRPLLVRELCSRVQNFLGYIEHHEQSENDLAEFVFTQDIGSKD